MNVETKKQLTQTPEYSSERDGYIERGGTVSVNIDFRSKKLQELNQKGFLVEEVKGNMAKINIDGSPLWTPIEGTLLQFKTRKPEAEEEYIPSEQAEKHFSEKKWTNGDVDRMVKRAVGIINEEKTKSDQLQKEREEEARLRQEIKEAQEKTALDTTDIEAMRGYMEEIAPKQWVKEQVQKKDTALYKSFKEQIATKYPDVPYEKILKILEEVPEFTTSTTEQKALIIEKSAEKLYSTIEQQSRENIGKSRLGEWAEGYFNKDTTEGRVATAVLKGIGSLPKTLFRGVSLAREKKNLLKNIESSLVAEKIQSYGADLSKVIQESGLDISIENGATCINYLGSFKENLPQDIAEIYNEKATTLSAIPYEWQLAKKGSKEREAYEKARSAFEVERSIVQMRLTQYGYTHDFANPKRSALEAIEGGEATVSLMQFLTTHPDTHKELQAIGEQSVIKKAVGDIGTEQAALLLAGYAGRRTLSGLSVLASPVIGGVVGWFRGKKRAEEELINKDKQARYGKEDVNKKTRRAVINPDRRIEQLKEDIVLLRTETDETKKQEILLRMETRSNHLKAKLDRGEIAFGTDLEQITRQRILLETLKDARIRIQTQMHRSEIEDSVLAQQESRKRTLLAGWGEKADTLRTKQRKSFVRDRAVDSAALGALFGLIGTGIASLQEGGDVATEEVVQTTKTQPHGTPRAVGLFAKEPLEEIVTQQTEILEDSTNITSALVEKGGGIGESLISLQKEILNTETDPTIQTFFDRNIWDVAKDLNLTHNGESIVVQEGAYLSVVDNEVRLINGDGDTTVLGRFENNTFTPAENEITYTTPKEAVVTPTESAVTPIETYEKPAEIAPIEAVEVQAQPQTTKEYSDFLDAYFAKDTIMGAGVTKGEESEYWKAIKNIPAKRFMELPFGEVNPNYQTLQQHMRKLATGLQDPGKMSIEEYLKYIYTARK